MAVKTKTLAVAVDDTALEKKMEVGRRNGSRRKGMNTKNHKVIGNEKRKTKIVERICE